MSMKNGKSEGQLTAALEIQTQALEGVARRGLEIADKLGADAGKISTSYSLQRRLVVENKEFALANTLESRGLGILVHKDKKKGSASINTVSEEAVKHAVEGAMSLAKYSVPDEYLVMARRDEAPAVKPLDFQYNEDLATLSLEEIQEAMQQILARLVQDKRVALDRFEMSVDISYHGMRNTYGVAQHERQSMASWSFMGMARDDDMVTGYDFESNFSYDRDHLLKRALPDAERFAQKIVAALNPRSCPSYRGPVLLSPRAVNELLVGMILFHASGRSVMDGKSRWDKDEGKQVVSSKLTLGDHPHNPHFAGSTAFDGDGIPTKPQAIIKAGVLPQHLQDCYSAKRNGKKTTATAGGPFCLAVDPGTDKLQDLLNAHPQLLMVDRFSGNTDPVKGDFSGVAKSSRLFLNGKDAGAVTETMVAGNFFELAKSVLAVTDHGEMVSGAFMSPYVLVDGVSVTGQG